MAQNIRSVNKLIAATHPGYFIVQGKGYVYIWADETVKGELHPASWYSSSIPVCRVSDQTPAEWLADVSSAIEKARNETEKFGRSMS